MAMAKMEHRSFLWTLLLLLLCHQSSALMTTITHQECVYEEVQFDGDHVSGSFVVVDHGLAWNSGEEGVELVITNPSGHQVMAVKADVGQQFEFRAHQHGLYKFCFNNPGSTPETISFHIHVGHVPGIEDIARDEHLKPVNVKIAQLREALEAVSAEQIYLRARDYRHRITSESTNRRLIIYTVVEYVCLVGVSLGQVYLIRKLFDKRLGYNRV